MNTENTSSAVFSRFALAVSYQIGWAPYAHDYDTLATWIVVQGRNYTGGVHEGVEEALLLRFFKGGTWVEVGATSDRELQAMLMFNF